MNIYRRPSDAGACALLNACALPTSDLESRHFEHFFAIGPFNDPSAIVGLELLGACALLRSLAVSLMMRKRGAGAALVRHAESYAHQTGVREIYLLTASTEEFFAKLGYRRVPREAALEPVRETREFSSLCPASATFMRKAIIAPTRPYPPMSSGVQQ
ncbi:MAG: arsenic resistance N-acetyltransferase ArsN2 [Gammaproteobacteria bacterium]